MLLAERSTMASSTGCAKTGERALKITGRRARGDLKANINGLFFEKDDMWLGLTWYGEPNVQ